MAAMMNLSKYFIAVHICRFGDEPHAQTPVALVVHPVWRTLVHPTICLCLLP